MCFQNLKYTVRAEEGGTDLESAAENDKNNPLHQLSIMYINKLVLL